MGVVFAVGSHEALLLKNAPYAWTMPLIRLCVPDINKAYPGDAPEEWLQLGYPIYIRIDTEQRAMFSEHPQSGYIRYAVTAINRPYTPPDKEAVLDVIVHAQTPRDFLDEHLEEIEVVLNGIVKREVILRALRNIASTYRVQDMGLTLARRASEANTFVTVSRRLDLCRKLAGQSGADLIGLHQRNLVLYLLLTCFDRLGQPAPYLSFESWLESKKAKHRDKRDAALVGVESSPIAQARALNQAYVAEYGVRNSFFRFLDDVLPREQYQTLITSLWSHRTVWGTGMSSPMSEIEKRKYLYQLRNAYTHQAEAQPGLTVPFPAEVGETPPEFTAYFYEQVTTREGTDTVSFSNWPKVLEDCVLHGLAERVRQRAGNAASKEM